MTTDIQKLPSGFYAVWLVEGANKMLVDAASVSYEQAFFCAMDQQKKVGTIRSWRVINGVKAIRLTQAEAEYVRTNGGQVLEQRRKFYTQIGADTGCFYCPEKYMCDRVCCPEIVRLPKREDDFL